MKHLFVYLVLLIFNSFVVIINPTIVPIISLIGLFTASWGCLYSKFVPEKIQNKIPVAISAICVFIVGVRSSLFILSFATTSYPIFIINLAIDISSIVLIAIIVCIMTV